MDGNSTDSSFSQRARSLGWRTRTGPLDSPHDIAHTQYQPSSNLRPSSLPQSAGAMERKQGESRRTIKRLQEEGKDGGRGVAQATTTDITALMDNYFFFNSAHAKAATRALGGGPIKGSNHPANKIYDCTGANDSNLYRDNEELESRFVRTWEWVGEASKVISPSSSLSKEYLGSRSLRAPLDSTTATSSLQIVSTNNGVSEVNESRSIIHLNDATSNDIGAPLSRDKVTDSKKSMGASISGDDFERASFRPPPNSVFLRGDIHAVSFRAPEKPLSNGDSNMITYNNSAYEEMKFRTAVVKGGGPSATCKLPCQSCGNGPSKKGENLHGDNNHDYAKHGYIDADKLYNKPNYAMGLYERNDRLARSAYHHNSQRKVHPNESESLSRSQKFSNMNKEAIKASKEIQQVKEKPVKAKEKAWKEVPTTTAATKVQQWFSRLIGKNSKPDNAKRSIKAPPIKVKKDQGPLNNDHELVIHGATMHDVLTNGPSGVVHNQGLQPRLDATHLQLKRQPPPQAPPPPNSRPPNTNHRADLGANPASNPAPISANHEGPRESSRRFVDDARAQRFGYGSKSERWAPLHLKQDEQRQAKEYHQLDKQSLMQGPIRYNDSRSSPSKASQKSLMQAPIKYNGSKSARSSPSKAGHQQQYNMKPVEASSMALRASVDSGNENKAVVVNQEKLQQKHYRSELEEREPPRIRPNQDIGLEVMPYVNVNEKDQYIQDRIMDTNAKPKDLQYIQSRDHMQINAKQYYAKEANVINDYRQVDMNRRVDQYNPRAFVASYASQSERFSQRHRVEPEFDESRRSISARISTDINVLAKKGTQAIQGEAIQGEKMITDLPPPPPSPPLNEDRDIEILNTFLIQKKANLNLCSFDSRIHFILSTSSLSSMIAALCYAWILHNTKTNQVDEWERVPVISITRNNMWNYKQLAWLFEQAGLDTKALIFINEVNLDAIADSVGEYRISTIGQDIIRPRGEVASFCTIVAEAFFKQVETSLQAKCIRILLLAGLLIDTENLDSTSALCTRRDEVAASFLLPGAGHKGRAVLLAELRQGHASKEFYNIMCENYGEQPSSGMARSLETGGYVYPKQDVNNYQEKEAPKSLQSSADYYQIDFYEDNSSIARSKSSKSYTSASTTYTDQGKSRSSSTSPPSSRREMFESKNPEQSSLQNEESTP